MCCVCSSYRKDFRQAFKLIGEIRSLIPVSTNVLACTATATVTIYEEVSKVLALETPHVVALTPDRANITYSVQPKQDFDEIVEAICIKMAKLVTPLQFPKTVIFCQRYYIYGCACMHAFGLFYKMMPLHRSLQMCLCFMDIQSVPVLQGRRLWMAMDKTPQAIEGLGKVNFSNWST